MRLRATPLLFLLSSALVTAQGAEVWVHTLSGDKLSDALAHVLNDPNLEYARSKQCKEYGALIDQRNDRQTTVYYVCRLTIRTEDWGRLQSGIRRTLTAEAVPKDARSVCPYDGAFSASSVHVTSRSLSAWGINQTAIYANETHTELLACMKVLILP